MPRAVDYLLQGSAEQNADRGCLLNMLGVYYSDAGFAKLAEGAFHESLQQPVSAKHRALVYMNLAREYGAQQRWQDAVEMLRAAQQLDPGNPQILESFCKATVQTGDVAMVMGIAEKLRRADPDAWVRLQSELPAGLL